MVEGRNPKIVDDWPLHRMKDSKTKTVVGACWHGGQQRMVSKRTGMEDNMEWWVNRYRGQQRKVSKRIGIEDNKEW